MCKNGGRDFQACLMNADGSGTKAFTRKTGRSVVWAPDGQTIIFHRTVMTGDEGDEQIFSIDLAGNNEKQLTFGPGLNGWANPGFLRRKR